MKLFLIAQDDNYNSDYYDAIVVCADNEKQAIMMTSDISYNAKIRYIREAAPDIEQGIVCASFYQQ